MENIGHHVFKTKDGKFRISVTKDFLTKCPTPEKYTAEELHRNFACFTMLHHPTEPAVINFVRNVYEYWIDKKNVGQEDKKNKTNRVAELESKLRFKDKLHVIVNDGEKSEQSDIVELLKGMELDPTEKNAEILKKKYAAK